ncbi:MAG: restriction endonuclease subunit S [Thiobacillus sp.]|nr:restriction endonuclease subunit S [Thiobacillus sp.]
MNSSTVVLGKIAKISSGGTPDRDTPSYWGGDIPWVKTTQIQNRSIYADDVDEWITPEGLKHSAAKMVPKGTILMAMYGQGKTRGQVAILGLDATVNQACAAIELDADVSRNYVYQQLLFRYQAIRALSNTGSQENLNAGLIREIGFPLPARVEQDYVAELLTNWDAAIEKTERLIVAKENYLNAIEHQLLTARKRLNGFSNSWESLRADKIFDSVSLKGFGSEPLLSVTQDCGVIPRDMLTGRVTMPSGETTSFKLVEPGNFVISLRSFQGGLEHSDYRGLVSPAYTVLRATREIDVRFFRHYFRSADFIKRLSVAVIGIRDGKQVSFKDFCSIKIPFPPVEEQQAIATMLDEAEREIALLRNQVTAFKKQKRGLMQKLLTGQWRVTVPISKEVPHA